MAATATASTHSPAVLTMPRPQRSRRQPPRSSMALPYARAASPARRRDNSSGTSLPDDALAGIFARLPHAADVVRCAATCARWRRVVATSAAPLSPPPPFGRFLPHLAVGVFHLPKAGPTTTRTQPRFLATAASSGLLGRRGRRSIGSFFDGAAAAAFDGSRPVSSRGGRLVLELRREIRAGSVTLCVCNPMTGDAAMLPPLSGDDTPADYYGCALLTGDDLHPTTSRRRGAEFFRLLLVYTSRRGGGFTALRCYSSDTGRWGPEARSAVSVTTKELRDIGGAAVRRGVAFWPLDNGALGVRLDGDDPDLGIMDAHLLPYDCSHEWLKTRLLGVSPDGRLFLVYLGIRGGIHTLMAKMSYFDIPDDEDGGFHNGRKESSSDEEAIPTHQMKMDYRDLATLKLRWIGDKSGLVLFTMGGRGGHDGAHVLSLQEGTVEKLADEGHSWGSAVGFEMDWAAYLSSMAHDPRN
ncbi:unnamed protein product [Urochloa decumbens]|uniref:F-box domain-containing protein n=1 Tax=Urochloa decumbens TaxID=240449 RepID=A0ABC8ZQH3_9POAL